MPSETRLLGVGIYTVREAARLTKMSASRIRRWLRGYTYKAGGSLRRQAPVWRSRMPDSDEGLVLDFQDLCEIRIVDAFVRAGVSLQHVRKVASKARAELSSPHPFLTREFKVSGRKIFRESLGQLCEFSSDQAHFRGFIEDYVKDIDFAQDEVLRWWPLGRARAVVIDPEYCFGKPVVVKFGVPTQVLAQAVRAEGNVGLVAGIYRVPERVVRDAVEYEQSLAA